MNSNHDLQENTSAVDAKRAETKKFVIKLLIGLAIGFGIALIKPPELLTQKAMWFLGILCSGIFYLTVSLFAQEAITGLIMLIAFVIFKISTFDAAFGGFGTETWFLFVGGFGIGAAVVKTGLLSRVSKGIARIFPATFKGQVMALMVAGTAVAPFIPSMAAKASIIAPFPQAMAKQLGLKLKSRGATGLFAAGWIPNGVLSIIFVSGFVYAAMTGGMTPEHLRSQFSWLNWFKNALPWALVMIVGLYFATILLYSPKKGEYVESADDATEAIVGNSPLSKNEKITAAVIILALTLWVTGQWTGLGSGTVALIAFILLCIFVMDRKEIGSLLPWSQLLFMGTLLSLGTIMPALKIDKWLLSFLGGILGPLFSNVYLLCIVMPLISYFVKVVVVSNTAAIAVFYIILLPFAVNSGMDPAVAAFITCAAMHVNWYLLPQNSAYVAYYYGAGGEDLVSSYFQSILICFVAMALNIAALLFSIPFWKMMGLMP